MQLSALPIIGRIFTPQPERGNYQVTLPPGWDQWTPAKGDASAFFDKVNFVKHVSSTLVETANSVASPHAGAISLNNASAEEHGIPDSALHFPGYTGHYVTVHATMDPLTDELQSAQMRVHRYEGHEDRTFSVEHLDRGIRFTTHRQTVLVAPDGAVESGCDA